LPAKGAKGKAALLLTPGASATRAHHALVAIDRAVSALGVVVERIDLNARAKPEKVIETIAEAASTLADRAGVAPKRVVLGGRSFGGRMCSMAVADGLPALGLVLVSYPLHPPGKPDQARTAHFPRLRVPCLFVSGTRDAFATPEELTNAARAIKGRVRHVWLDGGDHGLRRQDEAVADAVGAAVADWL
jgi:predicted alpha/beta-hydrolase family hydrolase